MNAPTPAEFAREVAEKYAPSADLANPFFKPAAVAVQRLLLQAVAEVLGPQDPFSQFANAYERAFCLSFPSGYSEERASRLEICLAEMRAAWEVIELDTLLAIEETRG